MAKQLIRPVQDICADCGQTGINFDKLKLMITLTKI